MLREEKNAQLKPQRTGREGKRVANLNWTQRPQRVQKGVLKKTKKKKIRKKGKKKNLSDLLFCLNVLRLDTYDLTSLELKNTNRYIKIKPM